MVMNVRGSVPDSFDGDFRFGQVKLHQAVSS